jgi:Tol biopolymer transport system component
LLDKPKRKPKQPQAKRSRNRWKLFIAAYVVFAALITAFVLLYPVESRVEIVVPTPTRFVIDTAPTQDPLMDCTIGPTDLKIAFFGELVRDDSADGIYLMNPDGSCLTRLTGEGGTALPAWSPDGQQIAYTSVDGLHVMNADGRDNRLIVPGNDVEFMVQWSPDGQAIAYTDSDGLYTVKPDGSDNRLIYALPTGLPVDDGDSRGPFMSLRGWTPDGTQILAQIGLGYGQGYLPLEIMNADGSNRRDFLPEGVGGSHLNWTDNGLLVSYWGTEKRWILAWLNHGGTLNRTIILEKGIRAREIALSPDGTYIAFADHIHLLMSGIHIMNADGTNPRPLADGMGNLYYDDQVSWSPDGSQIVFQRTWSGEPPWYALFSVDPQDQIVRRLTPDAIEAHMYAWRPVPPN